MTAFVPGGWGASGIVAVVPARDEEMRLPAALASLRAGGADVLVVANGCTDGTAAVARAHGAAVLETARQSGGVGAARRAGSDLALSLAPGASILLATDADCRLAPGAMAALTKALDCADAAMGRVVPDPAEFALLPAAVRRHGDLEDERDALLAEIGAFAEPRAFDPMPRHGQCPGALMAFRVSAYRTVGGFAPIPCSEDRDIARRLVLAGLRVAHPWEAVVLASCRLKGRAQGGMADTIAARTRADLTDETRRLERQCVRLRRLAEALRQGGGTALGRLAALVADTPEGGPAASPSAPVPPTGVRRSPHALAMKSDPVFVAG